MTRRPPGAGSGRPDRRQQELMTLLQPVVEQAGFDLETITVSPAGRRSVVRVVVDSDGGVNLDDIAAISRGVSERLDAGDDGFGSAPYTLEVTSPGVDRPLTEPRHWRRATGRLVQWQDGGVKQQGRVISADENTVTIQIDGRAQEFRHSAVSGARVQVEFNRPDSGKETP